MGECILTADVQFKDNVDKISLNTFIGQRKTIEMLSTGVSSAKARNESLGHVLISGPRGSGKSTLATAIANDLAVGLKIISVRAIKSESEFAAILTNVEAGDVLLFENINSIKPDNIDLLCTAMEDFCIDLVLGKGTSARSIRLELPKFTIVATLDEGTEIPQKLTSCFTYKAVLDFYNADELTELAYQCARKLEVKITEAGATTIALASKGDFRKLFNTIKRARDFALVKGNGEITEAIAKETISYITDI